jgi:hypothetical protein
MSRASRTGATIHVNAGMEGGRGCGWMDGWMRTRSGHSKMSAAAMISTTWSFLSLIVARPAQGGL